MTRKLLPDTIKIAVYDRTAKAHVMEEVDAKIVGPLAFRKDGQRWRGGLPPLQLYSITHIASGLRVIDEIDLKQVRRAIQVLQGVDWADPCFTEEGRDRHSSPVYKGACEIVKALRWELMQ